MLVLLAGNEDGSTLTMGPSTVLMSTFFEGRLILLEMREYEPTATNTTEIATTPITVVYFDLYIITIIIINYI